MRGSAIRSANKLRMWLRQLGPGLIGFFLSQIGIGKRNVSTRIVGRQPDRLLEIGLGLREARGLHRLVA